MKAESNYDRRATIMIGFRPPFRKSGEILLFQALETLLEIRPYFLNRGEVGASGWLPQEVHEPCEQVLRWSMRRRIVLLEKVTSFSECSIPMSNNQILRQERDVTFSCDRNGASDQRSSISALADATPDYDLDRMRFLLRARLWDMVSALAPDASGISKRLIVKGRRLAGEH
jgi:hypothetical protein